MSHQQSSISQYHSRPSNGHMTSCDRQSVHLEESVEPQMNFRGQDAIYEAKGYKDSSNTIIRSGMVQNTILPGYDTDLLDMVRRGSITGEEYRDALHNLYTSDEKHVSKYSTVLDRDGCGNKIFSTSIFNETSPRPKQRHGTSHSASSSINAQDITELSCSPPQGRARVGFEASLMKGATDTVISADRIHNHASPGYHLVLEDMLSKGHITSSQLSTMYDRYLATLSEQNSQYSAVLVEGGTGNRINAKILYNQMAPDSRYYSNEEE